MSIFFNTNNDYNSREIYGLKTSNSGEQNYNIIKKAVDNDDGTWYISYPGNYIVSDTIYLSNNEIILLKNVNVTLVNGMSALLGNVKDANTSPYTRSEANTLFFTKSQANSLFVTQTNANTLYFTKPQSNTLYYTKDEANTLFYNKTQSNAAFVANVTYWDDLRFPAFGINPVGTAAPPASNTMFGWLDFDPSTINIVAMQAQLPHEWRAGTTLHPHVHWMKNATGTGDVTWRLEYRWCAIGEKMDANWTQSIRSNVISGIVDTNTVHTHLMTEFDDIDTTGRELSDMLIILLSRYANTATDTYTGTVAMLEFDIHYEKDRIGSTQEYNK